MGYRDTRPVSFRPLSYFQSLGETAEEARLISTPAVGRHRPPAMPAFRGWIELCRGSEVDGLTQVIRGRVIALGIPGLKGLLFRRAFHPTELEGKCRHTLFNKAVLIAADEAIMLWFLIGLYLHARFGNTRTSSPRVDSSSPWTSRYFKGNSGRYISILMSATIGP